jgi:biotin carboxylase
MQAAGVPTVPGSDGLVRNPEEAFKVAKEVQHPSYPAFGKPPMHCTKI